MTIDLDKIRADAERGYSADPPTVLALLDRVAELEAAVGRVEALADRLTWKRPEKSPCEYIEECCGSEANCDAMQPSVAVVGDTTIRAALAGESDE